MITDDTGAAREQALADYQRQADLIEADLAAERISRDQAATAMCRARQQYEQAAGPLVPRMRS